VPPTGIDTPISERLRAFTDEYPFERAPILAFVAAAAKALPPGARVLDVGAGDAPYAELFAHADYVTVDWAHSPHPGARDSDVVASADDLPFASATADAVLFTQVLEHVFDPRSVLGELHRVLRPGACLFLTAPLAWELHEIPHDYFRYTAPGLEALSRSVGFVDIEVVPRNDCFSTLAQLLLNARWAMGRAPDGLDPQREQVARTLEVLAERTSELAPLDVAWILPLGYNLTARRAAE
jgi:SAM-dependent methyltransferase